MTSDAPDLERARRGSGALQGDRVHSQAQGAGEAPQENMTEIVLAEVEGFARDALVVRDSRAKNEAESRSIAEEMPSEAVPSA